ncbi:MAG: kelch repeat-containing protein [Candidatus Bathyarchaeota archaeon]
MKRILLILMVLYLSSNILVNASESPSPRMGATMFYDPVNQRILLYGGASEGTTGYTRYNDLWSYDYSSNSWTEIETPLKPSGRFNTPAAFDLDTNQLIIIGGASMDSSPQMWAFNVVDDIWRKLTPSSMPSPDRWNTPLVYDEKYNKILMYSGMAYRGDFPQDMDI